MHSISESQPLEMIFLGCFRGSIVHFCRISRLPALRSITFYSARLLCSCPFHAYVALILLLSHSIWTSLCNFFDWLLLHSPHLSMMRSRILHALSHHFPLSPLLYHSTIQFGFPLPTLDHSNQPHTRQLLQRQIPHRTTPPHFSVVLR